METIYINIVVFKKNVNFKPIYFLLSVIIINEPSLSIATSSKHISRDYHYLISPVENWVNIQPLPDDNTDTNNSQYGTDYLIVDKQVNYRGGDRNVYYHSALMITNSSGLEKASKKEIQFYPEYEVLTIHSISIIRDGKKINKLVPKNISIIQQEENLKNEIYTGKITALIFVPDSRVGDVIDLSYSIKGNNPIFENKISEFFTLEWAVSIHKIYCRLLLNDKRNIFIKNYNIDCDPVVTANQFGREYIWTLNNTESYIFEDDYPNNYNPYHYVQVSEYKTWKEISQWASSLYPISETLGPELNLKLSQLIKNSNSLKEKIQNILHFVQNDIRYLGIETGINSHRPHKPNVTYKNRYGDCKDKTLLLINMLNKIGIKAYPALVSTSPHADISNILPTPFAFNHVICLMELNGKEYWLDGTRNFQGNNLDTLGYQNLNSALIINHPNKILVEMPESRVTEPNIKIEEEFLVVGYEGPIEFNIRSTYIGETAEKMRGYFAVNSKKDINNLYLNYFAKNYPSISIQTPLSIQDDMIKNIFTILESYWIDDYWDRSKDNRLLTTLRGSALFDFVRLPQVVNRKEPLKVDFPVKVTHKSAIRYPEYFNMELTNKYKKIEDDIMKYEFKSDYLNNYLTVEHYLETKTDRVLPGDMTRYVKQLNKINNWLYYDFEIFYKKNKENEIFKNLLMELRETAGQ